MNSTSCHPTKHQHQSWDNSPRIVSSTAPDASVGALEAKISSLKMLRVQTASDCSSLSHSLSSSTAIVNAYVIQGSDVQTLRIPTKSENCDPGPTLNPASCASGLALIGGDFGGGEGDDWTSALSLTTHVERRINGARVQGNTRRRNPSHSHPNEDWGDLHYPQARGNLFLGNGDI